MTTEIRLRADARRNRAQILAAATRIFADRGVDVPMEEIARAASVGVGTLYRRFPDRETLIRAVARMSFEAAVTRTRAALDEEPTAWAALVRMLHHAVDMRLVAALFGRPSSTGGVVKGDPLVTEHLRAVYRAVDDVVAAAQAEGTLRPDVGSGDIVLLYSSVISRAFGLDDDLAQLAAERGLTILLDGLRARPDTPLAGNRLTVADVGLEV